MSEAKSQLNFRALQTINEHRNAYGLRYNDYKRYRNHCGNRTHRLRSTLKMTHGKGREFKKLPPIVTENMKNEHLQLFLFESERAWAYSQELYAESLLPANADGAAKLRHRATGRFRRAIHWCTQLLSHCHILYTSGRLSAENVTEINAYTLILSGRFLRHRDEFEDALDQLCVARDLLAQLARCAATSKDQALAAFFIDEITPEIRHSAHELGHAAAYDVDRIVSEIAPKNRTSLVDGYDALIKKLEKECSEDRGISGRVQLEELVWEGQVVPVRNPELVDVLLRVQEARTQLESDKSSPDKSDVKSKTLKGGKQHRSRRGVAAFDAILAALSDAEDVSRRLLESQGASNTQGRVDGPQDAQFLYTYIVFQLLQRRIERDRTLISALVATGEQQKHTSNSKKVGLSNQTDARVNPAVVKLLDTTLQSLTQMRSLSIVDESHELASAVDARLAYVKAQRCQYLARSYAAVKKFAESLVLLQRGQLHIRESSNLSNEAIVTVLSSTFPLTSEIVRNLSDSLEDDLLVFKREWFAHNGGVPKPEKDTSKKPLFFDIAINYVQLDYDRLQERAGLKKEEKVADATPKQIPTLAEPRASIAQINKTKKEEIERPATPEPGPARGGLGSLLGGWWGRK